MDEDEQHGRVLSLLIVVSGEKNPRESLTGYGRDRVGLPKVK